MEALRAYMLTFVGIRYKFGGEHPSEGYDCSGLVQEFLASCGEDQKGDQTAQGIYDWWSTKGCWTNLSTGALLFFGKDLKHVSHVAMAYDQYRMIEAAGGGRKTKTIDDAIAHRAMVRMRLITSRSDVRAIIRPHYAKVGAI